MKRRKKQKISLKKIMSKIPKGSFGKEIDFGKDVGREKID